MDDTDPLLGPAAEHVTLRPRTGDVVVARINPHDLPENQTEAEAVIARFAAAVRLAIPEGVEVLIVSSPTPLDIVVVEGSPDVGG